MVRSRPPRLDLAPHPGFLCSEHTIVSSSAQAALIQIKYPRPFRLYLFFFISVPNTQAALSIPADASELVTISSEERPNTSCPSISKTAAAKTAPRNPATNTSALVIRAPYHKRVVALLLWTTPRAPPRNDRAARSYQRTAARRAGDCATSSPASASRPLSPIEKRCNQSKSRQQHHSLNKMKMCFCQVHLKLGLALPASPKRTTQ